MLLVPQKRRCILHCDRSLKDAYPQTNLTPFQGNAVQSRVSTQFTTVFKKTIQETLSQRNCDFQTGASFQGEKRGYQHNLTAAFCVLPHDFLLVNAVKT